MIYASIVKDGRITRTLSMPTVEDLLLNIEPDEMALDGLYDPDAWYVEDGIPTPIPPRPEGEHWQFDHGAGEWVDARPADWLQSRREAASLDKSDLLIALHLYELLPEDQIRQAMAGVIPDSLAPMMATLPPEARLYAEIKWANDGQISRMNPVILAAAHALGLPDELVDQIFGVTP